MFHPSSSASKQAARGKRLDRGLSALNVNSSEAVECSPIPRNSVVNDVRTRYEGWSKWIEVAKTTQQRNVGDGGPLASGAIGLTPITQ